MKLGMVFPQNEIGNDPAQIKALAQGIESLGFDYLLTYDHVLGADPAHYTDGRKFVYTYQDPFHEVFVLFGWLTALTQKLELVHGILILPQRDAILTAKQAIELDLLSEGRFRLGIGVGWNQAEMEGLGHNFHTRGARMDEQIGLMRELWSKPLVNFAGKYHRVENLGLNPLPQHPIPLWVGGTAEAALKRAAQHGDGWIVSSVPVERVPELMTTLNNYLAEFRRDVANFGVDVQLNPARLREEGDQRKFIDFWREQGATHIRVNPMGLGLKSADEYLRLGEKFLHIVHQSA